MDGIHDMGGMEGFGDVNIEAQEPVFHSPWEGRAFAMNLVAIGVLQAYNPDEYRHALERMAPIDYLNASYYERVLTGVASLLIEKKLISMQELSSQLEGRFPLARAAATVNTDNKPETTLPHFAIGDKVRVRDIHPSGHTRVPRYVRGHLGEVIHVAPRFSFPDASAHGLPFRKEPTYHVLFDAAELWTDGADTSAHNNESVVVDLWESYLESAS
jgi:nitrile hydratase beta subunit